MSGEVDKWSVEQCQEWLATNAGWTKRTRDMRRSIRVADPEADAKETAWIEEHGFHCVMTTGGVCTYWTHPTERSVMGENPPWYPATLTSAANALPDGWQWKAVKSKHNGEWKYGFSAWGPTSRDVTGVVYANTELEARFRLAVKARMAGGGGGGQ